MVSETILGNKHVIFAANHIAEICGVTSPVSPVNTTRAEEGAPVEERESATSPIIRRETNWVTVVHNDPVNLMEYVKWIFQSYFKMDSNVARMKMLQVHHDGRAVVARGGREQMERDVQAMHVYGLWATIEPEVAQP